MKYTVGYIRSCGIECRWTKTRSGQPIIVGKTDSTDRQGKPVWAVIDDEMWRYAQRIGDLKQAFDNSTALVNVFSVPA